MVEFRFSISELSVYYYRYIIHTDEDLTCREMKEDGVHFVLCCHMLQEIKKQFIPPKFCKHPCLFRINLLLTSTNERIVRRLSIFLYKAFKVSDSVLL